MVTYFNSLKTVSAQGLNASTSSYDDMVKELQDKGYIDKAAKPVDMNTAKSYLKDNTGGHFPQTAIADKANDYNGVWLLWWDQQKKTNNFANFTSMANNQGTVVLGGGAATLTTAAVNGSYAIAFSQSYAKKDAATAAFKAIDSKTDALPYLNSALSLAKLFQSKGYIANAGEFTDLEKANTGSSSSGAADSQVSFAASSVSYEGVTIFYFGATPAGPAYANYLALEDGGKTITGYTTDAKGKLYSAEATKYKDNLKATDHTYHVDAYFAGFAISFDKKGK